MSCYSTDWHYVTLMLLCVIPQSSVVQVTYVACSSLLLETWGQMSSKCPLLKLPPVKEDKVQMLVSAFWLLNNIRA